VLVGESLVVDYFTFVLENLANSALHRVSGDPLRRWSSDPGDSAQMQSESYRGFHVVIHELINQIWLELRECAEEAMCSPSSGTSSLVAISNLTARVVVLKH